MYDATPTPYTTTRLPRQRRPPAQPERRPFVDGLTWLWRQWQQTAPVPRGTRGNRPQQSPVYAGNSANNGLDPEFAGVSFKTARASDSQIKLFLI